MAENPDDHAPDLDEVRAVLAALNAEPSEHNLQAAVKLLTGFTDEQLDELGGFPEEG